MAVDDDIRRSWDRLLRRKRIQAPLPAACTCDRGKLVAWTHHLIGPEFMSTCPAHRHMSGQRQED